MLVYRNGVLVCGAPENPEFGNIEGEPRDNAKLSLELDKTSIQKSALPTPVLTNLGTIYQYIGETDGNLINGRFYKCVETLTGYEWKEIIIEDKSITINKLNDNVISTTIPDVSTAVDTKLTTEKAVRTELDLKLNRSNISVDTATGVVTITY